MSEESSTGTPPAERRLKVLVIDDDTLVRTSLGHLLGIDHDVTLAASGPEGLASIAADGGFDAILCDLNMPGMDGVGFHEALLATSPDTVKRTIYLTGGAFTPRAQAFLASIRNPTLQKPFEMAELRRALQSVAG